MGHITKQERRGLEELFIAIDHGRYDSKLVLLKHFCKECRHTIKIYFKNIIKK